MLSTKGAFNPRPPTAWEVLPHALIIGSSSAGRKFNCGGFTSAGRWFHLEQCHCKHCPGPNQASEQDESKSDKEAHARSARVRTMHRLFCCLCLYSLVFAKKRGLYCRFLLLKGVIIGRLYLVNKPLSPMWFTTEVFNSVILFADKKPLFLLQ